MAVEEKGVRVMKVHFVFYATAYMSKSQYHLDAVVDNNIIYIRWPSLAAYLVNKYSLSTHINEDGFGYIVDLPENAVLALMYAAHRQTPPSKEELDEIVEKGTTRLHMLRQLIGDDKITEVRDLFLDLKGKGLNLGFANFPKLVLYNFDEDIRVEFDVKDIESEFLKRALNEKLAYDEIELLRGLSLLQRNAQMKYMALLFHGQLTKDDVARALYRSAIIAKDSYTWLSLIEWLKRNGYDRKAGELLVKKTLVEGR